MPRRADEKRDGELYDFRAALTFVLVMFVLVIGGLSLIAYLCRTMVG